MSNAREVTAGLTRFWLGTREMNLATLEQYYDGTQTAEQNGMLTATQRASDDVNRFFKPVNYIAAVVDEPTGYLARSSAKITAGQGEEGGERLDAWGADFYQRRIAPRADDIYRWQGLYGEVFLHFWTDKEGYSRGLKLDVVPPIEGGRPRVIADYGGQDPEELTAVVIFKRVPVDSVGGFNEYRISIDIDEVVVERRRVSRVATGSVTGGDGWVEISREENPAHVLPCIPVFNPVPSDILNIMDVQDDLDKLHMDMRLAREYGGTPMLTTEAHTIPEGLSVGPGRILFGGKFNNIPPASLETFLEERKALLESMAKIAKSVTLLTESGNNESGVALKFRQQAFLERINSKAQRAAVAFELALNACARILATDPELYDLETRRLRDDMRPSPEELMNAEFSVELEPFIPADDLVQAQVAQIWASMGLSRETVFAKAGVANASDEVQRADEEMAAQIETARAGTALIQGDPVALPPPAESEPEE